MVRTIQKVAVVIKGVPGHETKEKDGANHSLALLWQIKNSPLTQAESCTPNNCVWTFSKPASSKSLKDIPYILTKATSFHFSSTQTE